MKTISFIITNYNTKKYTQFVYNSIRKNLGYFHEIVMCDDGSDDGTWEWLQEIKKTDHNMIIHRNETNIGIAYSYNKMVELSSNEIVCMLHSDMYVPPKFDEIMLKYMEDYDFITPVRVEPNVGYPPSLDKILMDFGTNSDEFDELEFLKWNENNIRENEGRVEQRMFFPWMTTKTLYNKVGGNDCLFLKYMVDDDDFYLRIKMAGGKYTQLFETAVYHMPSKSVRMREDHTIGTDTVNLQYRKSIRNFIRKWGCMPGDVWDDNRDMVVPTKYNIGCVVENCNEDLLSELEPWFSNIYVLNKRHILRYTNIESHETAFDLSERIRHINSKKENDVLLYFDALQFTNERMFFIQNLTKIIKDSGSIGNMNHDIFFLEINKLEDISNHLIKNERV